MGTSLKRRCLPLLIIAYNRPNTTSRQLERLDDAYSRDIHFFIDGPKQQDIENQGKVVQIIEKWAESTSHRPFIHISKMNLGIRNHFPLAAESFFSMHNQGIILEDDIAFRSNFLDFCEQSLKDSSATSIWSVCGYNPQSRQQAHKDSLNSRFLTNIHTIHGWATFSESIERYLSYRALPKQAVLADIVNSSHNFTSDPFLRRAIELTWKRKYLRSVSESGGGSWDNSWELAAWHSCLPSIMPSESMSAEIRVGNEIAVHDSPRKQNPLSNFYDSYFLDHIAPLNKSRDIRLLDTWGITRPYAWRYPLRIRRQLRTMTF